MKTAAEAKAEQDQLRVKGFDLGWYFGTKCEKCCGVYPRFMKTGTDDCFYQCDVCGKRTAACVMPWVAEEAWNNHQYTGNGVQMNMFMEASA